MKHRLLIPLVDVVAAFVSSCCSMCCDDAKCEPAASAQAAVDSAVGRHADLVRLTIHAVPTGESAARVVATNSDAKRGKPSDPEDLKAFATGETIVLAEGDNVDVTLPLRDSAGAIMAVAGVTLANPKHLPQSEIVAQAQKIAAELQSAMCCAKQPLW